MAEARVLAALLDKGFDVLVPFGGGLSYDLAYDDGHIIRRIQVKTGKLGSGIIAFHTASVSRSKKRLGYGGRADEFGVYCAGTDRVYLVPVSLFGINGGWLRVNPTKNNQSAGIHWAADYEIGTNG